MALVILGAVSGCSNPRNIVDVVGQLLNVKISALDSDQVGFTLFRSVSEEEGAGTICSRCRRCSVFWYSGWAMPPTLAHISLLCLRAVASCDCEDSSDHSNQKELCIGKQFMHWAYKNLGGISDSVSRRHVVPVGVEIFYKVTTFLRD